MAGCVLPDGRRIGWTVLGEGFPVIYLHGLIGSSLRTCAEVAEAVEATGAQIVMPSRPGFGRSTRRHGRTLQDAARDVATVADALHLHRFGVLGVSAGGPVALACAQHLSDRVAAAAVVSGACAIDTPLTALERHLAWCIRHRHVSALATAPAVAALRARGAGLRGSRAMLDDGILAIGPNELAPETITSEIHVWHGADDPIVPAERALALADRLPNGHATVLLGEGHFFLRRRLTTVLGTLIAAADAQERTYPAAVPAA